MAQQNFLRSFVTDANTDLGSHVISAAETVTSASAVDLGTTSFVQFEAVIDVSAIDVASTDEVYTISVQLGDASDFSGATVERACIRLGDASQLALNSTDSGTGRYVLGCDNAVGGTGYRYVRLSITSTGTTPALTATAFLSLNGGIAGSR